MNYSLNIYFFFFWKSIFHAFQISSRAKYNRKERLPRANHKSLETSSKQDSLISASQDTEKSNFFHCLRPKRRALCPPISHPIPRDGTIPWLFNHRSATNSRTSEPPVPGGTGFARWASYNHKCGPRVNSPIRSYCSGSQTREVCSPTALAWHTVCPSSAATREKDRLDFHSFIFTAISLIATPSLLLRSPTSFQRRRGVSFTLIPGFTLITRSAALLPLSRPSRSSAPVTHPSQGYSVPENSPLSREFFSRQKRNSPTTRYCSLFLFFFFFLEWI